MRGLKAWLGVGAVMVGAMAATLGTASISAGATPNAATLYREALATTKSWSVHYASDGLISNVPILLSGDAGPASGTQVVLVGTGTTTDNASLIVIGDLTYLKGNTTALEDLANLTAAQAAADVGQWLLFSTNNPSFSQVVAGVRSRDVSKEIALQGPYSMGPSRVLDGYRVDAIRGTQRPQGAKAQHAILYVRASGRPLVVEEDTVNAQGKLNGNEHIIFSKWGESVQPKAPQSSITLGPVNAT